MDFLENYKRKIIRIAKYTLILEIIFGIGLLTPYSAIFLGLILGTAVSLLNTVYAAWKVNKIGELAADINQKHKTKYSSTGMFTRMALSLLTIMLVLEYPQYFNLYATLTGLFITQIISAVDTIKSN
ncbi:MAG: ATP synthase subunit I [Vulcanibacillus sp.]